MRLYQHIVDLCPDSNDALVMESRIEILKADIDLGDDPNALADFNDLIADFNDVSSLPRKLASKGDEFFYRNDYPKAIAIWEMVLTKYPGRKPNYIAYLLATCYKLLEDYPTAIEYYKQVLNEYPNCQYADRVPYNLGSLHRRMGEYEKAVYWFEKQPELYSRELPRDWSLYARGVIHLRNLGQPDRALELFTQYLQEFPDGESAHVAPLSLADCCVMLGDVPTAMKILQEALPKYGSESIGEEYRRKLAALAKGGTN